MTVTTVAEILAGRGVKLYIHPSHNMPGDTTATERLEGNAGKKAMIEAADTLVVLTISEKLGSTFTMQLCKPQKISYLITELSPTDKKLDPYRKNMEVL
ncbi:MAG: hypothetical protein KF746_14410 [Chitinophagaceae bacterium]|nr:hypothetical protein [Chitinophagaceae bacterium]